jgi:hypothetical protein
MDKLSSLLFWIITLYSYPALASLHLAPPGFEYHGEKTIFIDIERAHYDIVYDYSNKTVQVESTIVFKTSQAGLPIFDLVPRPIDIFINGVAAQSEAISDPDKQTTLRIVKKKINPGTHKLRMKHSFTSNVVFGQEGLASAFWMSDLNDRRYLEQYLPTNLEYDQYQMSMSVNIIGAESKRHILKANGKVLQLEENSFVIDFPAFYSASSVYFHLFPEINAATNVQFYYRSIDGRMIPVDIYTSYNIQEFVSATKTILKELEADYGPFPHNQLIIYGNAPSGGMEYAGATATSLRALGHELFHCYHARALMPANGNAGWMDEAIARWRDNRYPLTAKLSFSSTRLAGHSVWSRMTDRMAYTEGSAFLSWIAYRMHERGKDFKHFLREYFDKYKYTAVTTQLFQAELTKASGLDLSADFDRYIYGKSSLKLHPHRHEENPYHPRYTAEQLLDLTWL